MVSSVRIRFGSSSAAFFSFAIPSSTFPARTASPDWRMYPCGSFGRLFTRLSAICVASSFFPAIT